MEEFAAPIDRRSLLKQWAAGSALSGAALSTFP